MDPRFVDAGSWNFTPLTGNPLAEVPAEAAQRIGGPIGQAAD
jgi:hypothetical protein